MSDKANVLTYGHDLWQRVFKEVQAKYPPVIESSHMYVDALTMQMVLHPKNYEVIVTYNMFGDIITDLGAALQGGLGMAASANINPNGTSMFEPVHGSAPKFAGKDVANPFGAILTVQLMLEHLGFQEEANLILKAVRMAISENQVTRDIGGPLGTHATGDFISNTIRQLGK